MEFISVMKEMYVYYLDMKKKDDLEDKLKPESCGFLLLRYNLKQECHI